MPYTSPYRIVLTDDERRRLEAAAGRYTSPYRDVVRARIVLYAERLGNCQMGAPCWIPRARWSPGGARDSATSAWPGSATCPAEDAPRLSP